MSRLAAHFVSPAAYRRQGVAASRGAREGGSAGHIDMQLRT